MVERGKRIKKALIECGEMLILLVVLLIASEMRHFNEGETEINAGWNITINDEQYQDASLESFVFHNLQCGDTIVMDNVLPKLEESDNCIRINNIYCYLEVYIGDMNEPVYVYGEDTYKGKDTVLIGTGYHWISLTPEDSEKPVRLVFGVGREKPFSQMRIPVVGSGIDIIMNFVKNHAMGVCVSVFLIMAGLIAMVLAAINCLKDRRLIRVLYAGAFCLTMGVWLCCNNRMIQFLVDDYIIMMIMEYLLLYLLPIPIVMFFAESVGNKKATATFYAMAWLNVLFATVTTALQIFGIVSYYNTLLLFHILMLLEVVVALYLFLKNYGAGNSRELNAIFSGVIVLLITMIYDIFRYQVLRYWGGSARFKENSSLSIGVLVFVVGIMKGYFFHFQSRIQEKKEKEVLERLAYEDYLTGLWNRAKVEAVLEQEISAEKEFAIVSLDLNSLKEYNDTKGHIVGDRYITHFATHLKLFWEKMGYVARIGGDEFMIIVKSIAKDEMERHMREFMLYVAKVNEQNPEIKISVSYGIGYAQECEEVNTREVYRVADARMYEMKKKYHRRSW